jgi:hypothetical protein
MRFAPHGRCRLRPPPAWFLITVAGLADVGPILAVPKTLLEAIPDDALAVHVLNWPTEGAQTAPGISIPMLTGWADQLARMGWLADAGHCARAWVDTFAVIGDLLPFPHAVVLLDYAARPRSDGGHELAGLKAALIVQASGRHDVLERRIQHLLRTYTNSAESSLDVRIVGEQSVHVLTDRRLPDWVVLAWGAVDDLYVVTIGEDVFPRVVRTHRAAGQGRQADTWLDEVCAKDGSSGPRWMLGIRFDRVAAAAAADSDLRGKIQSVVGALGFGGADRGVWTLSMHQRAVEIRCSLRRGSQTDTQFLNGGASESMIPGDATWYGALDFEPATLVRRLSAAYLAARSPDAAEQSRAFWASVQRESAVNFDRDILARLATPVVVHDHPRHAFRLPLIWTYEFPVRSDPADLRAAVDRIMEYTDRSWASQTSVRLQREESGFWFLQFGIQGPAIGITDEKLFLSFSPHSVRVAMKQKRPKS